MRFIDEVDIEVIAGKGGDGCVAFRRESKVPKGGPSGGDGGRGGDVVLIADCDVHTLLDCRYQRLYRAKHGGIGRGSACSGASGLDRDVRVPVGTIVFEGGQPVVDLTEDGQRYIVAKGGRGGNGNLHYVSSTNRAPRKATDGEPGEAKKVRLELRLLADVALVGQPNAGKSTLLSVISAARPRIGDYPFTTLVPNLGVVALPGGSRCVVADIPGLIEGAADGLGLGHQFLRHVSRAQVLCFVLDGEIALSLGCAGLLAHYEVLVQELARFSPDLASLPRLLVVNKTDLLSADLQVDIQIALGTHLGSDLSNDPVGGSTFGSQSAAHDANAVADPLPATPSSSKHRTTLHFISGATRDGLNVVLREVELVLSALRAQAKPDTEPSALRTKSGPSLSRDQLVADPE